MGEKPMKKKGEKEGGRGNGEGVKPDFGPSFGPTLGWDSPQFGLNSKSRNRLDSAILVFLFGGPEDGVLGHEPCKLNALQLVGTQLEVDEVEAARVVEDPEEASELHKVASEDGDELLAWCIISLFLIVVLHFATARLCLELSVVPCAAA
ncbi:hypothetical protein CRG98_042599 [Punica granatum]|uniref:Uncharacterized protein n=1 Tax=Punica granatum TaxID=22663 RepID=A0A2I0HZT5_PUNGR|nr:hypothetical protein CRG98_042599 [Punica granatum]